MTTFISVYRGESVGSARLIAVSVNPEIVSRVVCDLLGEASAPHDPVLAPIENGRRRALHLIKQEVDHGGE